MHIPPRNEYKNTTHSEEWVALYPYITIPRTLESITSKASPAKSFAFCMPLFSLKNSLPS